MSEPASTSGMTSPSLLDRARGRDEQAWERLVRLYSPLVFHWCRQSGLDSHDAADLMQEVFHSVSRHLDRFERGQAGAFRSWLWTITRNKIRDRGRKLVPTAEGGSTAAERWQNLPDAEPEPGDDSVSGEQRGSLLHRALELIRGDFTAKSWSAFEGVILKQKPAAEVAAELGLTTGAVYQARARVLLRLREELGDEVETAFSRE